MAVAETHTGRGSVLVKGGMKVEHKLLREHIMHA